MKIKWIKLVERYRRWLYLLIAAGLLFLARRISLELLERFQVTRTVFSESISFILVSILILLGYFVMRSVLLLLVQRYRKVLGSMLSFRLAVTYLIATVVPVMILTLFITYLINMGISVIHQPRIERALKLSIDYLRSNRRSYFERLQQDADRFFKRRNGEFLVDQPGKWKKAGRVPLSRFRRRYQTMFSSVTNLPAGPELSQITRADQPLLLFYRQLKQNRSVEFIEITPPPLFSSDAENVGNALAEYRQIRLYKEPLKYLLVYMVLIIAALSILLVMMISMRQARRLTLPVIALAEGTRRVANGDLSYRVQVDSNDELRLLVANFNRMTVQLRRSRQQLYHAERIAAWQEVARRLAHEIKNPLTPIKLSAERLLRRNRKQPGELDPVIEKALSGIVDEVDNIKILVDEFASFARLPEKRVKPVEVTEFVKDIMDGFRRAHEDVELQCQTPPAKLVVPLDPEQIRRALVNLIQNGIRAAQSNRQFSSRVVLNLEWEADTVTFVVKDNGKGIPENEGVRIFDPYYSSAEGGTGLGLAIVEKIVLDHGGRVWFESETDKGTDFYIEIPLKEKREQGNETHFDS